jgi:cytosine deaminase
VAAPDRLLSNARHPSGDTVAIAVGDDGVVTGVLRRVDEIAAATNAAAEVVDLGGRLVLPALAEPHAHLDKARTADMAPNPTGDLAGAIDAWLSAEAAGAFTEEDMVERISTELGRLLLAGVTSVRSHLNVGGRIGARHLVAARTAADRYRGVMDVEFVALTHTPTAGPGSEQNRRAVAEALELGVEVIGGCPHLEPDPVGAIEYVLDIAASHGVRVDLHTDETTDPTMLTLETLAEAVRRRGPEVAITASHCVSLGMAPVDVQDRVASAVAAAGVAVIALPQTNLFLQGREHPVAPPRGLTALRALRAAGVVVAAGADNVQDPFNLVGRSDPFETAAMMVMAGHVLPDDAFSMVSTAARAAIGRPPVGPEVGLRADLVAVPVASVRQAVAEAPADRIVLFGGRPVARTTTSATLLLD